MAVFLKPTSICRETVWPCSPVSGWVSCSGPGALPWSLGDLPVVSLPSTGGGRSSWSGARSRPGRRSRPGSRGRPGGSVVVDVFVVKVLYHSRGGGGLH